MSQLPRYESYKDSGVQWLGEIPSHWGVMRLKNSIVSAQNGVWGDEPKSDENDLYCLRVADFDRRLLTMSTDNLTIRNISEKDYLVRRLAVGDLLLEKSGGGDKQPVGFVVQNNFTQKAVCSNFVAKVVLKHNMDSRYWTYHHQVLYNARVNTRSIKQSTGIQNLDATLYFNELACFPPIEEQILIALFLDKRLAQVDALISKQETLLEKLAEQRVALISHAVTKGLNPDVELKDSGDVFFGKIPKHWKVIALHFIVRLISGDSITALDFVADGDYPVYGGNGFRGYIDRYTHQGNYVLIGRQGALCGNINFASGYFFATEHAVVVNPLIDLNYKWLGFLLMAMNLNQYSTTAAQPGISAEVIGRLKILLPEIEEQNQIADFIETELRDIEELENKAIVLKDKLKEYCSTLITQVVTGKIDVRNLKVN